MDAPVLFLCKGGKGSGDHGHQGRPGHVGGSAPSHHGDGSKVMRVVRASRDPDAPERGGAAEWRGYVLGKLRGRRVVIEDNGVTVEFFRSGLEASLKNRNQDARAIYASLPEILRHAVYLGYETNAKLDSKPGIVGYERYAAAVELDGAVREVVLTVDVVEVPGRGRGYYYHQVGEIVVGDAVGSSRALEAPASPPPTIRLADLPSFGKAAQNNGPLHKSGPFITAFPELEAPHGAGSLPSVPTRAATVAARRHPPGGGGCHDRLPPAMILFKAAGPPKKPRKRRICMTEEEFMAEHRRLLAVLRSPGHADDLAEAEEQAEEVRHVAESQ